jgi:nucleoside phosphorylase
MNAVCEFVIIGIQHSVTEYATNRASKVGPLIQEKGITWCNIEFTEQSDLNIDNPTQIQGVLVHLKQMGRVSGALVTWIALEKWAPKCLCIVGTIGGFASSSVKLNDIIVASKIIDYEIQRIGPSEVDHRPTVYYTTNRLQSIAMEIDWPIENNSCGYIHLGTVLSGDKIIASKSAQKDLLDRYLGALGVEMETGGVAMALKLSSLDIDWAMIRGVADLADDVKSRDSDKWEDQASMCSVAFAIELLLRYKRRHPG